MSLTEIGSITIDNVEYKLGRNGGHVHLVRESIDAWGNRYGEQIDLSTWLEEKNKAVPDQRLIRVQSLLDQLGETRIALRQQRDARLGSHKDEQS